MYIRILRFEDIPYLMSLERNNKTAKGWERILKRGCSIGVIRGDRVISYVLAVRKRKGKRMEVSEFYSSSISASVVMWANFIRRYAEHTFEYTGRNTDLEDLLPAIERFTEGVSLQKTEGLVEVQVDDLDFRFTSYHMVILDRLTNKFSMMNVGMRIFLYELFLSIPLEEVANRKRHIIQSIHRRNKEQLNQIDPNFKIASIAYQPTTETMRESYERRLQTDGYQKYDSEESVPGQQPTGVNYLIGGNHFYGTIKNQLARVRLFSMTSCYQKLTYAFYRHQLRFIGKAHTKEKGKVEWVLLDRQGYEFLRISRITSTNMYHMIPRNFTTVFDAVIRDGHFYQDIIERLNSQYREEVNLIGYFGKNLVEKEYIPELIESAIVPTEDLHDFISSLGEVKRILGRKVADQLVSQLFSLPNLPDQYYGVANRIRLAKESGLLTNKAFALFVSPVMEKEKQKEVFSFLENMKHLNSDSPYLFQTPDIRKGISSIVKKERVSKEAIQDFFFNRLVEDLLSSKKHTKKGEIMVKDMIQNELRKMLPYISYSAIFRTVHGLFDKPDDGNKDWYLETVREIFNMYRRSELVHSSGHEKYLFNTYIAVRKRLGKKFFLKFADKWHEDLRNSDSPDSFIHDTGYIYDDFCTLFDDLSDEAIKKALMEMPSNKLHVFYQEVNQMLRTLSGAGLEGQENLIYDQLNRVLLNDGTAEDLNLFNDPKFLHSAFRRYGVIEEEVPALQSFVERMKRYNNRINALSFLSLFKKRAIEFVRGTYKGLFEERVFELPNDALGDLLHAALGDKETKGIVPHPRKLFTKLNKLGDVQAFIRGEIPKEKVQPIASLLKQVRLEIPNEIKMSPLYRGVIEPKGSPEFLVAGNASVCCMSFGEDNAYEYAVKEGFGIFNIYYKGRVIANSVLWINELEDSLVIDNIEVHPNYEDSIPFIKKLYFQMIEFLMQKHNLKKTVQGSSYNDLELSDASPAVDHRYRGKLTGTNFYTDADYVKQVYPLPEKKVETVKSNNLFFQAI